MTRSQILVAVEDAYAKFHGTAKKLVGQMERFHQAEGRGTAQDAQDLWAEIRAVDSAQQTIYESYEEFLSIAADIIDAE